MTRPKRQHLLEVTEKNQEKAFKIMGIVGAYKAEHRLPTLLDAMLAILTEWQETNI